VHGVIGTVPDDIEIAQPAERAVTYTRHVWCGVSVTGRTCVCVLRSVVLRTCDAHDRVTRSQDRTDQLLHEFLGFHLRRNGGFDRLVKRRICKEVMTFWQQMTIIVIHHTLGDVISSGHALCAPEVGTCTHHAENFAMARVISHHEQEFGPQLTTDRNEALCAIAAAWECKHLKILVSDWKAAVLAGDSRIEFQQFVNE
jgi:hypothetical protein